MVPYVEARILVPCDFGPRHGSHFSRKERARNGAPALPSSEIQKAAQTSGGLPMVAIRFTAGAGSRGTRSPRLGRIP